MFVNTLCFGGVGTIKWGRLSVLKRIYVSKCVFQHVSPLGSERLHFWVFVPFQKNFLFALPKGLILYGIFIFALKFISRGLVCIIFSKTMLLPLGMKFQKWMKCMDFFKKFCWVLTLVRDTMGFSDLLLCRVLGNSFIKEILDKILCCQNLDRRWSTFSNILWVLTFWGC